VRAMLEPRVQETFLPLLRTTRRQAGKSIHTVRPLFPCYLFGLFNVETEYHFVSRTSGVVGVICAGDEPSQIAEGVILEIKRRAPNGIVDLPPQVFHAGEAVQVGHGPLSGVSAVFERYLSGSERAALLLEFVGGANVRVVLPSDLLVRAHRSAP
jgi:transcriptional antiterminator RfaH